MRSRGHFWHTVVTQQLANEIYWRQWQRPKLGSKLGFNLPVFEGQFRG